MTASGLSPSSLATSSASLSSSSSSGSSGTAPLSSASTNTRSRSPSQQLPAPNSIWQITILDQMTALTVPASSCHISATLVPVPPTASTGPSPTRSVLARSMNNTRMGIILWNEAILIRYLMTGHYPMICPASIRLRLLTCLSIERIDLTEKYRVM